MIVQDIRPDTVSQFMSHLKQKGLSDKYRKNIYSLLRLMFELALTFDFIKSSPVRPLLHRPSIIRSEKPTLPLDKAKAFFDAIKPEYKAPVALLILTGMRQSEMLGLRWQDIDFEARLIHKRNVVYRGKLVEGLKQNSRSSTGKLRRHVVGMSDTLKRVLEAHRSGSAFTGPDDFVFCRRSDGQPLDPGDIRKRGVYPALKAAGIPFFKRASGLHLFRHTVVSEMAKRLGLKMASEQVGHSDINITASIYAHVDTESKIAAASALGDSFDFVAP